MIGAGTVVLRLVLAALLGGVIGFERERVESAAGLRTHALVALGSALVMIVSSFGFVAAVHAPNVVVDPSRVAAQVVSGIGFLGAGVIVFRREIIRGLTTAASVWAVAGIGLAVGGGMYLAAVVTTLLGFAILAIMKPVERRLVTARHRQPSTLIIDRQRLSLSALRSRLEEAGVSVESLASRLSRNSDRDRVDLVFSTPAGAGRALEVLEMLAGVEGILEVRSVVELRESDRSRWPLGGEPDSGGQPPD